MQDKKNKKKDAQNKILYISLSYY